MTDRERYERGAQLTYRIVLEWKHPGGVPIFAFPPRDFALLADLREVGATLARNTSASDLVAKLIDDCIDETGQAPTAMMLRTILQEVGYPIEWTPLEKLQLPGKVYAVERGRAGRN